MIRLSGIKKTYRDGKNRLNHVLRGIDLHVKLGEFVTIRGASGSGKTTLLSILGTLLQPDEGCYWLNGKEISGNNIDHALVRNRQIGFVFQDHRLLPQYTVLENILLPALACASEVDKGVTEYAYRLMELMHIANLSGQYPETLSGGEASRVTVCRALIMKPLLLLADEPTGQLDVENARNIVLLLSNIHKTLGTTIIMATHSDETSAVSSFVYTLGV